MQLFQTTQILNEKGNEPQNFENSPFLEKFLIVFSCYKKIAVIIFLYICVESNIL